MTQCDSLKESVCSLQTSLKFVCLFTDWRMEGERETAEKGEEEEEREELRHHHVAAASSVNYQDLPIMHWEDLSQRIAELEKQEQERRERSKVSRPSVRQCRSFKPQSAFNWGRVCAGRPAWSRGEAAPSWVQAAA